VTDVMIHLDELTKRFPGQDEPAVDRVTMDIPRGEIVVFVGPSGCGKTTTMKLINRLIEPTSGRIVLDGEDVTKVQPDELRRRIGYVIQQIGLFPHRTIAQNIATVPKMLGWDDKRIDARVDELLDKVGLAPGQYRHRYPKELSGGQRQRVGVVRALMQEPKILLADEPTASLDPKTSQQIMSLTRELSDELSLPVLVNIHNVHQAKEFSDRVVGLRYGTIIFDGTAAELDDDALDRIYEGTAGRGEQGEEPVDDMALDARGVVSS
jgi:osmoprotectant transport system ATP-binding protein